LASHFNDDDMTDEPTIPPVGAPPAGPDPFAEPGTPAMPTPAQAASAAASSAPVSEAVVKFRSCRWRRPPDEGTECCGHRDVLPIAGTTSFDAEAWCPDCAYFKLRRVPKKREYY
jgi:hypothetical protein